MRRKKEKKQELKTFEPDVRNYDNLFSFSRFAGSKPVYVRININSVRDIDTVNQTFRGDVFIEAQLSHSTFQGKVAADIDHGKHLKIRFLNLLELDSEEIWTSKPDQAGDTLKYRMRVKGTFTDIFLLQNFPFDVQKLSIRITADQTLEEINYKPSSVPNVIQNTPYAFQSPEWKLWDHFSATPSASDPSNSASGSIYPHFNFTFHIQRRWNYYVWNVFFILFAITSIAATSFAVPPTDASDRLSIVLTMVLTAVAFKFVVTQNIPKIPYNTVLDTYVIAAFLFLSALGVENALVGRFEPQNIERVDLDSYVFAVIAGLWLLFNIIEIIRFTVIIRSTSKELKSANIAFHKKPIEIPTNVQTEKKEDKKKSDTPSNDQSTAPKTPTKSPSKTPSRKNSKRDSVGAVEDGSKEGKKEMPSPKSSKKTNQDSSEPETSEISSSSTSSSDEEKNSEVETPLGKKAKRRESEALPALVTTRRDSQDNKMVELTD